MPAHHIIETQKRADIQHYYVYGVYSLCMGLTHIILLAYLKRDTRTIALPMLL